MWYFDPRGVVLLLMSLLSSCALSGKSYSGCTVECIDCKRVVLECKDEQKGTTKKTPGEGG